MKIKKLVKSIYKPERYWATRENPNAPSGETEERIKRDFDFIRKSAKSGRSVFELGPGVGRTLHAYPKGTKLTTCDITDQYQSKIAGVAAENGLSVEQHKLDSGDGAFPFEDNTFDVGVCCQVFLHQPEEVFIRSFGEFARVAKELVIIAGYQSTFPELASTCLPDHVFSHDYIKAASDANAEIMEIESHDLILYLRARSKV